MSIDTTFSFQFKLHENLPKNVKNFLLHLADSNDYDNLITFPKHLFTKNTSLMYFKNTYIGTITEVNYVLDLGLIFNTYGEVKNCNKCISDFVDFMQPYINEPVGYTLGYQVLSELEHDTDTYTWYNKK